LPTLAAFEDVESSTTVIDGAIQDTESYAAEDAVDVVEAADAVAEAPAVAEFAAPVENTAAQQPDPTDPDAFIPVVEISEQLDDPIADQVIVRFDENTTPEERDALIEAVGGVVIEDIPALDTIVLTVDEQQAAEIETRVTNGELAASEPDYMVSIQADITASDPLYTAQWNLPALGIDDYWAALESDAAAITVAVIDSGICQSHPDLAGRIAAGYDYVENDTVPQDENGHGCAMAGVMGANINNIGITGLAPGVNVMPLRVLDAAGLGSYSDVSAAIVYAADNGADVINMSLAGSYNSPTMQDAVNYAVARGVTVVASAGNAGVDVPYYPAAMNGVISVGSVDQDYSVSNFSNYGDTVDVYVPGRDIWTTYNTSYSAVSGTSPAAAHVSGLEAVSLATGQNLVIDGPMSLLVQPEPIEEADPTPTEPLIEAQNTITGVTDPDDRTSVNNTIDFPGVGVVQLRYGNSENGECTGFLIDKEYILTAASCVVENTSDTEADNRITRASRVIAVPGANGNIEPYGKILVSQDSNDIEVAPGFDPENPDSALDYAVLKLRTPVPPSITNFVLTSVPTGQVTGTSYFVAGYPQSGNCRVNTLPENCGQHQFVTNAASAMSSETTADELFYQIDAAQNGQPGSPIYRINNGVYQVVGIHSRFDNTNVNGQQYNRGVRITAAVINQIETTWGIPLNSAGSNVRTVEAGDESGLIDEITFLNSNGGGTIFVRKGTPFQYTSAEVGIAVLPTVTTDIAIIGLETDNNDGGPIIQETAQTSPRQLIVVASTGSLTLHNMTIQDFSNTSTGGAILVSNGAELNVEDVSFLNNSSNEGGAIHAQLNSVTNVYNSIFNNNIGNAEGGAIHNTGNLTVVNRSDAGDSVALAAFAGNNADEGGAIFNTGAGVVTIQQTLFRQNSAGNSTEEGSGGALYSNATGNVDVTSSFFIENTTSRRGGAVAHVGNGTLTVTGARFENNEAGPVTQADTSPTGEGAVMFTQGPVVLDAIEATENITYRLTPPENANDNVRGGAFDINGPFTLTGNSASDPAIIQGNKILFDTDRDADPSDAAPVSGGAAFYIRPANNDLVTIQNACISANLSFELQGIDNRSSVTVNATSNYWGDAGGPSGDGTGGGDGVGGTGSGGVNFSGFITQQPDDCTITTLPPSNDNIVNATELLLLEDDLAFNNANANIGNFGDTGEDVKDGDPIASCGITNKSVWFTYTPTKSYSGSISVN
ncbi:MAG: S8 family serine peptidase, partial [Chloroflexota bacterium]